LQIWPSNCRKTFLKVLKIDFKVEITCAFRIDTAFGQLPDKSNLELPLIMNYVKVKKWRATDQDHRMKAAFTLAVPITAAERHKHNCKLYTRLESCGGIINIRS